jgi:tRNA(Ile2)-agmatinylcytidine synthase
VRLNPNIPWKTRGNGAICIQFGKGIGKKIKIGEIEDENIFCYARNSPEKYKETDIKKIRKLLESIVNKYARFEDKNTNPGFVILQDQPSFDIYERTVKEIVKIKDIEKLLKSLAAVYKGYKNCRGIIGATAAIAWSPLKDKTYELIAYREKKKWGTKRNVDADSVKKVDKTCPSTFDNYDYRNKHNRLAPSSPCPILYGIRGDDEIELPKASNLIKSEKVDCWMIFETNQGTDDHLLTSNISDVQPYQSVIIDGVVETNPHTIKGGHVIFTIKDATGKIDCAAYEPTKEFRRIARELCIGDIVEVYGGVRKKPLTVNIEKIKIRRLAKQVEKVENPICPKCGKHMKSKGKDQGYKCIICGKTSKKPLMKERKRTIETGFYEVPVCARRHLSKPLKRMVP